MSTWVSKLLSTWRTPHPLLAEDAEEQERREDSDRVEVDEPAGLFWVDEAGEDQFEAVRVVDRSKIGAGIHTSVELTPGQQLWLDFRDRSTKAVVRYVRKNGSGFRVGIRLVPSERRREERQPVDGAAVVEWNFDGQEHRCPVRVRNATQFGLQVSAKEPLPVDLPVRIVGDNMLCFGVTCYCTKAHDEHLVGVHLSRPPQRLYREKEAS